MDLALTPEQSRLAHLTDELARTCFAPRAARYDQEIAFPHEDFADLRKHGLLAATVPKNYGGLGLGFNDGDIFGLWLAIKNIAKGDLSLGRCYEGHVNGVTVLANSGTEDQRRRYLPRVVEQGETFVFWGSEPANPNDPRLVLGGTIAQPVEGGYLINGRKQFSTSAGGATYAILFAVLPERKNILDSLLMPIIRVDGPGVTIEPEWWQPLGMRATVSHMVRLENVFVPAEDVIGGPGAYFKERWQAKFIPAFAASFLGAAEAAMEFALPYIRKRGKEKDPYILHHVANARLSIETMMLWLRHAATLWENRHIADAEVASNSCRYLAEQHALSVLDHAVRACGAGSLLKPHPLERILRDLQTYVRHENSDALLATIGRATVGLEYDPNFSRQLKDG